MLRVLLYLIVIAAVIYAVFWSINRRNADPEAGPGSAPPPRPQPRGPRGPDDDEDFLRELDRKRKQRPDDSSGKA